MPDTALQTVAVPFHGDSIVCVPGDDPAVTAVVLRPTCEAIGLDYSAQLKRLKNQPWATVAMMTTVDAEGSERLMATIGRQTFSMWLATIDTSRLKDPAVRDKIVLYQREAMSVLDRHFFGGQEISGVNPSPSTDPVVQQARMFLAFAERQAEQGRQLTELQADNRSIRAQVAEVEAKATAALITLSGGTGYLSLLGFCKIRKIKKSRTELAAIGRALVKACAVMGLAVKTVPDEKYGTVNAYPMEMLEKWADSENTGIVVPLSVVG